MTAAIQNNVAAAQTVTSHLSWPLEPPRNSASTNCKKPCSANILALGQTDVAHASRLYGDQAIKLLQLALWQRLWPPQICWRKEKEYAC